MLADMSRPTRIEPGPGQESVWDYPRPPKLDPTSEHVVVRWRGETIADTRQAVRVLETSQAPAYYLPSRDVDERFVIPGSGSSFCEWKGSARYLDVVVGEFALPAVGWTYPSPTPAFAAIAGHVGLYPHDLECTVDGERVEPMPGRFYGGWVTSRVVGPFKGAPGTMHW
jgi:uncharacterized protein (DUF427 family)